MPGTGTSEYKDSPIWKVIFVSWLIAFVEYCFQVPANRWGHGTFSAPQLKIMQEVITLVVFGFFSVWYLKEELPLEPPGELLISAGGGVLCV